MATLFADKVRDDLDLPTDTGCLRCVVIGNYRPQLLKFECGSFWCKVYCGKEDKKEKNN